MLKVESLTKHYFNGKGIENISFNLKAGEIMGVIGENGSGKTTLFKLILSLRKKDNGEIIYNKKNIEEVDIGYLGYLPEERCLYQDITVYEQIEHIAKLRNIDQTKIEDKIDYWLDRLKIDQYRDSYIKELSKGNQQKVQFVCSIIHDPEIVILDEPLTGLDVISVSMFKEIINELAKQKKTILISSHQFDQVEDFFNKVLILKEGKSLYCGDVDKLRKSSKKMYINLVTKSAKDYYLEDGVINQSVNGREIRLLMENEEKAKVLVNKLLNEESMNSLTIELPTLKDVIQERGIL